MLRKIGGKIKKSGERLKKHHHVFQIFRRFFNNFFIVTQKLKQHALTYQPHPSMH